MNGIDWTRAQIGQELEPLIKPTIEKVQLLKYAGASGDFNLIHTDVETAKHVGLPGTIAHGMLSMAFLGELCSDLVGTNGFVSRLAVRFAGMVFPEDVLTCRAKITNKNEELHTLDIEIYVERELGKSLTTGEATLKFYPI